MSYTYLLEQEEESSAECFLDIPQSVLSKLNLTLEKFCYSDNEMGSCQSFQSGTMSQPLMANHGKDTSISYAEDSLAKISAPLEMALDSAESDLDCGPKWPGSLARWNPSLSVWKTRQCSLFGGLTEFSEIWPRWGMMHDGEFWEQTPQEPVIIEPESGYVPTPCASDYKGGAKNGRDSEFKHWLKRRHGKNYPHPQRVEEMMLWPIGWSELAPLEMDKFQQWLHSHGEHL